MNGNGAITIEVLPFIAYHLPEHETMNTDGEYRNKLNSYQNTPLVSTSRLTPVESPIESRHSSC